MHSNSEDGVTHSAVAVCTHQVRANAVHMQATRSHTCLGCMRACADSLLLVRLLYNAAWCEVGLAYVASPNHIMLH